MAFTKGDANFASIVDGIVRARNIEPGRRYAVAIERTTGVIDNGVQEALELAQQTIDVASFLQLLETPGRSNKEMRAFVAALRTHLTAAGETGDDTLVTVRRHCSAARRECSIVSALDSGHYEAVDGASEEAIVDG